MYARLPQGYQSQQSLSYSTNRIIVRGCTQELAAFSLLLTMINRLPLLILYSTLTIHLTIFNTHPHSFKGPADVTRTQQVGVPKQ